MLVEKNREYLITALKDANWPRIFRWYYLYCSRAPQKTLIDRLQKEYISEGFQPSVTQTWLYMLTASTQVTREYILSREYLLKNDKRSFSRECTCTGAVNGLHRSTTWHIMQHYWVQCHLHQAEQTQTHFSMESLSECRQSSCRQGKSNFLQSSK